MHEESFTSLDNHEPKLIELSFSGALATCEQKVDHKFIRLTGTKPPEARAFCFVYIPKLYPHHITYATDYESRFIHPYLSRGLKALAESRG